MIKYIHFIWMGRIIKEKQIDNIVRWKTHLAWQSPTLIEMILWTDKVEKTKKVLDSHQKSQSKVNLSKISKQNVVRNIQWKRVIVKSVSELDGKMEQLKDRITQENYIKSSDSTIINEECWKRLMSYAHENRDEENQNRNYAISSDIYRLVALYMYGGVYMDLDNTVNQEFNRKNGTKDIWDVKSDILLGWSSAGNSYFVCDNKNYEVLLGALQHMAECRKRLDLSLERTFINNRIRQLRKVESGECKLDTIDRPVQTAKSLLSGWLKIQIWMGTFATYISKYELQRFFPPGKLDNNMISAEGLDSLFCNPRAYLTMYTTGPEHMKEYSDKDDRLRIFVKEKRKTKRTLEEKIKWEKISKWIQNNDLEMERKHDEINKMGENNVSDKTKKERELEEWKKKNEQELEKKLEEKKEWLKTSENDDYGPDSIELTGWFETGKDHAWMDDIT